MQRALAVVAALALATAMSGARAHDHAGHLQHEAAARAPSTVRIHLPDTALTDQDGRTARFKSQTVGDRLVLITFVYTTCTTVCPPLTALFADLQQRLGARVGRDVSMVTVTVDPLRDTPARLKAYAAQYNAGPGWSFLGGSKQAVDEVLNAFGVYTPNFADHPAVVLVGDPRSGEWTRLFGFPGADQILARLDQLQAARHDAPPAAHHH
ncbi:SCO family protein [Ramlibacter sp. AN1133]|uniref:SCO family protein n=1 Tax=Ramlibacter sp. AN1133 TaxID=3133429 RepID=UPI0030C5719B